LTEEKPVNTQISASRLRVLILEAHPENFMAFLDLFAIGCFLHLKGKKRAGRKAIDQVLLAVATQKNKTYLSSILVNLEGNEVRFSEDVQAHLEINELLDEN
jgi:hypothetical protein